MVGEVSQKKKKLLGEESSSSCGNSKRIKAKIELARSIIGRCSKRPKLKSSSSSRINISSSIPAGGGSSEQQQQQNKWIGVGDFIDTNSLFTPQRDFLVKNNGQLVRVDDLNGKTVVVYVLSLSVDCRRSHETLDMIEAYNELFPKGGFEFVFLAIRDNQLRPGNCTAIKAYLSTSPKSRFHDLFASMPFPAVPFSDREARDRLEKAFHLHLRPYDKSFWLLIDPTGHVVTTRDYYPELFHLYGGAELFPLTTNRILTLQRQDKIARKRFNTLDQLLASPTRDFLLSSSGHEVPISSLKDKLIGLYLCDNLKNPPRMESIRRVYEDLHSLGYNFEIVQINFHFLHNIDAHVGFADLSVRPYYEDIHWLTLPFKDPCSKRLCRIFRCHEQKDWKGDCLIIIDQYQRQPNTAGVFFEYYGAEIIDSYRVAGYPFNRQKVLELESRRQKERLKLKFIFPEGGCPLIRRRGVDGGCDEVAVSQLLGKRVLVFFATHSECKSSKFVAVLDAKYRAQLLEGEEQNKFEVVFISYDKDQRSFDECIKEMPWLVRPHSWEFAEKWRFKIIKGRGGPALVAFDANGELLAKEGSLDFAHRDYDKLSFPFTALDLEREIFLEVQYILDADLGCSGSSSSDDDDDDDDDDDF